MILIIDLENLLSTFNVISKIRNPKALNLDGISKQNQTKEQNEDFSFFHHDKMYLTGMLVGACISFGSFTYTIHYRNICLLIQLPTAGENLKYSNF